jgi:hypothetical protein
MSKFARVNQLHSNCNLLWFGLLGIHLEHAELLSTSVVLCLNTHNIETHCFGEGSFEESAWSLRERQYLHCPTVAISPSLMVKQGEQ